MARSEKVQVKVWLTPKDRDLLKLQSLKTGRSMSSLIEDFIHGLEAQKGD